MSVRISLADSSIPEALPSGVYGVLTQPFIPSGQYGLYIEDDTPLKIGDCLAQAFNATEARMNLTGLASGLYSYPMRVELEARDNDCYLRQGSSSITLGPNNERLQDGKYRTITIDDSSEAYIAVKRVSADGTLYATRIDKTIY